MQAILSFFAPTLTLIAAQLVALMLGYMMLRYADWIGQSFDLVMRTGRRLHKSGHRLWKWITKRGERVSRIIDGIALIFFLFGLFTLGSDVDELASLAPELISTSVAIAVLDRLFNYRSEQREKRRIISQLGATDSNDVALTALAVARAEGWLRDGTLKGVILRRANLKDADLVDANLEDSYLSEANLEGADLGNANLKGAKLGEANLKGADLRQTNLEGLMLHRANLEDAKLDRANFEDAYLVEANFKGAKLHQANLKGANLSLAIFEGAYLLDVNLEGADLRSVNFKGANLVKANLKFTDLFLAHFEGADLCLANLEGAKLLGASLKGAKYDAETIWPDGFDPQAAGAIFIPMKGRKTVYRVAQRVIEK